ncbi:MAG: MurR/RpiR family transcriptional regulator [Nitrospinae bacterium]|nr:MurR/RpiR family transcriptional regulator [Nitrospinota bacterium]
MMDTAVTMAGGALARIRGILPSLLPAERKVAEYLLADPEALLSQSVGEVSAKAAVSEATVIRFCRTAGFSGFQSIKIALARETVNPVAAALHEDIAPSDTPLDAARKIFASNIDTLNETLRALDPAALSRAADTLGGARRILVIGVGTSAPVAYDAYAKFMRLGLSVTLQTDAHLQMMEAALLGKGDAVLAISHSGSTIDPVETVRVAKKAGARAVAVTSNALSPLARECGVTLITASKETRFRSEALASRIAQASFIDALYVILGLRDRRRALSCAKKIEDVITSKQF